MYVFEEIADILIEAMNTFEYDMASEDKVFGIFSIMFCIMHGHNALWEYFGGKIQALEQQGCDVQKILQLIVAAIPQNTCDEGESLANTDEMSPEMQQLIVQIKEQLQLLIRQGLMDPAREIIAQVKTMVPCDTELEELEKQLEKEQ